MAYVSPPTKTTGDGFTAAEFNQNVRDNVEFLHAPPRVGLRISANVSISNNSDTDVSWNVEDYDTDTMHSLSSNIDRITAKTAGVYLVTTTATFAANSTGSRQIQIVLNNAEVVALQNTVSALNNVVVRTTVTSQVFMDVDDYVTARVYQDSGGGLNLNASGTLFRAIWLGA